MTYLNVEISGKGEPLVLLHGWGWSNAIWKPLIPLLSSQYTLYAVDLPGFGKSTRMPSEYSLSVISEWILNQVPHQSSWLGWSLGGLIAWWITIHFPERVNRLITVASSPCFLQKPDWPGMQPLVLEKFSQALNEHQEKTLHHFLHLQLRGSPASIVAELESKLAASHPDALKAGLMLLRETDLRDQLSQLACPSTHIFGEIDTIVPVSVANSLQKLIPHSDCHVIRRAGHVPFLSKPNDFLRHLLN